MKFKKMFYREWKGKRHETTTLAKIYNKIAQIGLTEQWIDIHQETNIFANRVYYRILPKSCSSTFVI
jgi:hypothetical protein